MIKIFLTAFVLHAMNATPGWWDVFYVLVGLRVFVAGAAFIIGVAIGSSAANKTPLP
jgi:hypothetical protein